MIPALRPKRREAVRAWRLRRRKRDRVGVQAACANLDRHGAVFVIRIDARDQIELAGRKSCFTGLDGCGERRRL